MISDRFKEWLVVQDSCHESFLFGDNSDFSRHLRQYLGDQTFDERMESLLAPDNFNWPGIQKELGKNTAGQALIDAFVAFFCAKRGLTRPPQGSDVGSQLTRDGAMDSLHDVIGKFNLALGIKVAEAVDKTPGYWIVYDLVTEWLKPDSLADLRSATTPVVFYRSAGGQKGEGFLLWLTCTLQPNPDDKPGLAVPRLIDFGLTDVTGILQPIEDAWQVSGLQNNYRCIWQIREHPPESDSHDFVRYPDALDGSSLQAAFLSAAWSAAGHIPGEQDKSESHEWLALNPRNLVSAAVDVKAARNKGLSGRAIPLLPVGHIAGKLSAIRQFVLHGRKDCYFDSALFCDKNCKPGWKVAHEEGLTIDRSCRNMGDVLEWTFSVREWKRLLGVHASSTWEAKWCNVHDRYGRELDGELQVTTKPNAVVNSGSLEHTLSGNANCVGAYDSVNLEDDPDPGKQPFDFPPHEWFIHDQSWFEFNTAVTAPDEQLKQILRSDDKSPALNGEDCWTRLACHNELASDPKRTESENMILSAVAGAGKTVASEWIEYRFNQQDCPKVAFRFRVHEFVQKFSRNGQPCAEFTGVIAGEWRRRVGMVAAEKAHARDSEIELWVTALLNGGKFCLILDALDEASSEEVRWLAEFMLQARTDLQPCQLVIAGRPRAIELHSHIFEQRRWRVIRVDGFNREQQIKYLGWMPNGELRYFAVPPRSHHLLTNPRLLSFLRRNDKIHRDMRPTELLYSSLTEVLLLTMQSSKPAATIGRRKAAEASGTGTKFKVTAAQVKLARQMLAVLVFECVKQNLSADDGNIGDIFSPRREEDPAISLRDSVQENCIRNRDKGAESIAAKSVFDDNWAGVAALNPSFLKNCEFDEAGDLSHFGWSSAETGEYLLAYYFAALASDEDLESLRQLIILSKSSNSPVLRNFFLFLSTMNRRARKEIPWLRSIDVLYSYERDPQGSTTRWQLASELVVRSMGQLKKYRSSKSDDVSALANRIYAEWTSGFNQILNGAAGKEKQSIAQELIHVRGSSINEPAFIKLCASVDKYDNGKLSLEGESNGEKKLTPFAMQRFCVTNLQFELFDPLHRLVRTFDNSDQYPVTQVSLFDAWCFAEWLGVVELHGDTYRFRLPRPDESEYACRCGETTQYTWHDREDGDECRYSWCHFDPSSLGEEYEDKVLRRPIAVDGIDGDVQVLPNPWGFYQLHGNVWEWCLTSASSKTEAFEQGDIRGGSWNMDASACRSSHAGKREAETRSDEIGFRLAMELVRGDGA